MLPCMKCANGTIKIKTMSNNTPELSPELKAQIEKEAEERATGFENKKSALIAKTEYALGAEAYALKWQQSEQQLQKMATLLNKMVIQFEGAAEMACTDQFEDIEMIRECKTALSDYNTYKQSKDGE